MVKYNTFEFINIVFFTNSPLHGKHWYTSRGALVHIKGSIGTQRVYINTVRSLIKKKVHFE